MVKADRISGEGRNEGGSGGGGGEAGGGGGGGRCRGIEDDTVTGGGEGRTGDESGEAAVGTERVVEREVLGVDEGSLGGRGGGGRGMDEGLVGGEGWERLRGGCSSSIRKKAPTSWAGG